MRVPNQPPAEPPGATRLAIVAIAGTKLVVPYAGGYGRSWGEETEGNL